MESCETCKYYKPKTEDREGISEYSGYCKRYPRLPIVSSSTAYFYIPEVDRKDWCGEWIQKMEE